MRFRLPLPALPFWTALFFAGHLGILTSYTWQSEPPTAQNYAIGCFGKMTGKIFFPPPPPGHIEGSGRPGLEPRSLYRAQLAQRLKTNPQPEP